jgi:hypothetical protein
MIESIGLRFFGGFFGEESDTFANCVWECTTDWERKTASGRPKPCEMQPSIH